MTPEPASLCLGCWQNLHLPIPLRGPLSAPFRVFGIRPSRMNPNMCTICEMAFSKIMKARAVTIDATVMFADLRGYTALTEGMSPRVLVEQVLNRYFTRMTEALYRHGGTIDKFLGDGIIGLFGVPIARPDDIQRALQAAVEMQRAFAELRKGWRHDLERDIGLGIGISYGPAVVGNIGSTQRQDYTVIGDVVNTASRLNGLAQAGQIVISHLLVDAFPPGMAIPGTLRERGPLALKGKQEPHIAFELDYGGA